MPKRAEVFHVWGRLFAAEIIAELVPYPEQPAGPGRPLIQTAVGHLPEDGQPVKTLALATVVPQTSNSSPAPIRVAALIPANLTLNLQALTARFRAKVRMIERKNLAELTGCERGAVSPLVGPFDVTVMDESLKEADKLYVSAGQPGLAFGMSPQDLEKAILSAQPKMGDPANLDRFAGSIQYANIAVPKAT